MSSAMKDDGNNPGVDQLSQFPHYKITLELPVSQGRGHGNGFTLSYRLNTPE